MTPEDASDPAWSPKNINILLLNLTKKIYYIYNI